MKHLTLLCHQLTLAANYEASPRTCHGFLYVVLRFQVQFVSVTDLKALMVFIGTATSEMTLSP
jgi:hypothetical protein